MSNYTKFQEMTRWQKFRLVTVSVGMVIALIFLAGLLVRIVWSLFMWGFNLIG